MVDEFGQYDIGDEEAGEHEEQVDTDEATLQPPGPSVVCEDQVHRDGSQSVELRPIPPLVR